MSHETEGTAAGKDAMLAAALRGAAVEDEQSVSPRTGKLRQPNVEMILAATSKRKPKDQALGVFMKRITHLQLHTKRISQIANLDLCSNLQVIYLYDNKIEKIENLNFSPQLTHIYLQDNFISKIENLPKTTVKLFLDHNSILMVNGLEALPNLQELSLASQRLSSYQSFAFDPASLHACINNLTSLNLEGNDIDDVEPYLMLRNLQRFKLSKNKIRELAQAKALVGELYYLQDLDLRENPVCRTHKYLQTLIGLSSRTLKMLDGRPVAQPQREMLQNIRRHKAQRRSVDEDRTLPEEYEVGLDGSLQANQFHGSRHVTGPSF